MPDTALPHSKRPKITAYYYEVVILGFIIYTGFVLPIKSMQGWLRWLNYLNPIAYSFEALMDNEFHNREFPCIQFIPI